MSRIERIGDATTAIYALCEYPSWRPRYVGKTIQFLHERHKAHIRRAKAGQKLPVHYWIRKQIANGKRLAIQLLEYVPPGGDWAAREAEWINKLRCDGADLLNLTAGGEGLAGHKFTDEHRARIASSLRSGDIFACLRCGSKFYRKRNEIARGHNKFCSRGCANEANKGGHSCAKK
jgi:hypothetical protein